MTPRTTRAQRLAMPLARDVVRDLAAEHGGCIRPVQLRRTDLHTGQVEQVLVPCGHTLAIGLPVVRGARQDPAGRAMPRGMAPGHGTCHHPRRGRRRAADLGRAPGRPQQMHDQAQATAWTRTAAELDELAAELDEEITGSGVRGHVLPKRPARRHRSTRRRQDTPDLPRRAVDPRTIGKTYTAPDGKTFRPSMFLTLTCDSYGKVTADGTPAYPDRYDYQRAARDALHFAALFDRLIQNLRRLARLRPPVLRRHRAAAAAGPARPRSDPRHRVPRRAAPGPRRHLPPGLVATHRPDQA